jgi:hypothetical protein
MNTWSIDTEYGWRGGDAGQLLPSCFVPVIFCGVCLETGACVHFWGRDPALASFIRGHAGDLFVSHNLMAEAEYLLRLGIPPPARWWDTMVGWRYATNAEVVVKYGLEKALVQAGLPYAYDPEGKDRLQKWAGRLQFDAGSPDDRRLLRGYCLEDCRGALRLYQSLAGKVPDVFMRYAIEFCLELARMELRGIAIDMGVYGALLENREKVVRHVTGDVNAIAPVFVNGQLNKALFLRWCAANGIGWPARRSPRTERLYQPLDSKTLERMVTRHPFIEAVYEANRTARQLTDRELAVDWRTARHYFGNIPFAQASGRTSFVNFLLSCPKWMRFLAVPTSPDHVLVAVDYVAEEICIASDLSHDLAMRQGYESKDPHMAFAILARAAPLGATKKTHPMERKKYKTVNLAVNYGQTEFGLAEKTGMHRHEARVLIDQHRRCFSTYWSWSDRYTVQAFGQRRCTTAGGWPRKVSRHDEPRSVANYPIQGTGSDLMRLSTVYLSRCSLNLLATNHDGFLIECLCCQLPEVYRAVDAALRQAAEQLLPGTPMRWGVEVFGDRYREDDEKALELWDLVNGVLRLSPAIASSKIPLSSAIGRDYRR